MLLFFGCATLDSADDAYKPTDADGDGWSVGAGDCDDDDAAVHPGATESWYDAVDQDCDGNDDDQDRDGAAWSDDCDDSDPLVFPGATESCNDADDDCDGEIDEYAADALVGWEDADGDGWGDPAAEVRDCESVAGYADNGEDCDDADAAVHPEAEERCNGLDDDCDGETDEDAVGGWYSDADGDGWGGEASSEACGGEGLVEVGGDCDDADAAVHPEAAESCNELDDDCDGEADEDAGETWLPDEDGDGWGGEAVVACTAPASTAEVGGDCDDGDATVSPAAAEACNGADDDCDGETDEEAGDALSAWADADGDGWGSGDAVLVCDASGWALIDGDCDEADPAIHPEAVEDCDGVDQDCDGVAEDLSDSGTSWADADGDGYGDAASPTDWSCVAPAGTVDNAEDCDDGDATISPAATESCNDLDDDCDDEVDEDGDLAWYTDADGDGWGEALTLACEAPEGTVADGGDCDDADADVNPGAVESCNERDDDCDGETDEAGAEGESTWYADADGDGWGGDPYTACDGELVEGGDCDDADAAVNPDATEVCNHVDDDCDGSTEDESGAGWIDGDGTWTDLSATLAAGSATDPVIVGDQSAYDVVVDGGEVHLCAGSWYLKFVTATSGTRLAIVGSGADLSTVSSGGTESGSAGSIFAVANGTMTVSDLTVSGGIGSSSSKGGGVVASQTEGTANPAEPNLTLERVVVSGNVTEYGGGIAINNYGWVSLVDTLVMDNEASIRGGGVWIQDTGKLSCSASELGAAGIFANVAPVAGGVYFESGSHGSLSSTGCDWGEGAEDNDESDVNVAGADLYCYGDAAALDESRSCSGGSCTASTLSCP